MSSMSNRSEDVCEEALENYVVEGSADWILRIWGARLNSLHHTSHGRFVAFGARSSMASFLEPDVCLGWLYLVVEPVSDLRRAQTVHDWNYNGHRDAINFRKVDQRRNSLSLSVLLDRNEFLDPLCSVVLISMSLFDLRGTHRGETREVSLKYTFEL